MKSKLLLFIFFFLACNQAKNIHDEHQEQTIESLSKLKTIQAKPGTKIRTKGFYLAGDGGAATYEISTSPLYPKNEITSIKLSNGHYANFIGNTISTKQFGFRHDLIKKTEAFDLNKNILSCRSCSFSRKDIGKAVYLEQAFWLGDKFQKSSAYAGDIPKFKDLPQPNKRIVLKVKDASDDKLRNRTGEQYYAGRSNFWAYLYKYTDMWFTITDFISPTKVRISYSAPHPLKKLSGKYGTNNWETWKDHLAFKVETGIDTEISEGDVGLFQSDREKFRLSCKNNHANQSLQMHFRGKGMEKSRIHYHYPSDTMAFVDNPVLPDNFFQHGFYGIDNELDKSKSNHTFQDFSIISNSHNSFRGVDGRTRRTFAFSNGIGTVKFKNIQLKGGDGWYYCGGKWDMTAENVTYDGMYHSEAGIQQFSLGSIELERCTLKNIGPHRGFTGLVNKIRGRPFYIHPDRHFIAKNCRFENNIGRGTFYSGKGKDKLPDPNIKQRFENCDFIWDKAGITGIGLYTSRIQQPEILNCRFIAKKGARMENGINISSGAIIKNCHFENGYSISNGANVGTNNVYIKGQPAQTIVEECTFKNAQLNFVSLPNSNAPHNFDFNSCTFLHDNSNKNTGQMMRTLGRDPKNDALTTVRFTNCVIEGILPGLGKSGTPILFCEPNGRVKLYFKDTKFNTHSNNGKSRQVFLVKQLRGDVRLSLENCSIEPGDTLKIDMDKYTGESGAKITAKNNEFEYVVYTSKSEVPQAFEIKQKACPKVLVAAKSLKGMRYNFNQYTVRGSIPIQNFELFTNRFSKNLIKGEIIIKASGRINFIPGGNIDINSKLALQNGKQLRFVYNPKIKKFRIKN